MTVRGGAEGESLSGCKAEAPIEIGAGGGMAASLPCVALGREDGREEWTEGGCTAGGTRGEMRLEGASGRGDLDSA